MSVLSEFYCDVPCQYTHRLDTLLPMAGLCCLSIGSMQIRTCIMKVIQYSTNLHNESDQILYELA